MFRKLAEYVTSYARKFWNFKYKYFVILTLFFLLWIFLLAPNTVRNQYLIRKELRQMEATKAFYEEEIRKNEEMIHKLKSDRDFVEKYGREKYLMKRKNEDIFLFKEKEEE